MQGKRHRVYTEAKQDFAARAGLVPQAMIFSEEQLVDLYWNNKRVLENEGELTYDDEQRIGAIQEQIERLTPDVQERVAALELKQQARQEQQPQEQTMY